MSLAGTIFLTILIGILAIIANMGKKSRRARISLAVILLFLSLLVTTLGLLLAFVRRGDQLSETISLLTGAVVTAAGLAGIALCIPTLRDLTGRRVKNPRLADSTIFLGFWMLIMVLAYNIVGFIAFTLLPDTQKLFPGGGSRLSPGEILINELPFLVIAVLGVGLGMRRNLKQTIERLGYGPLSLTQLGIVGLFIIGSLALGVAADAAFAYLQPELYKRVGDLSSGLFNPKGLSLGEAVLFALLIGVSAGVGEETLFRGAVQPALGITWTSILFASMHIQYGPSIILVQIFIWSWAIGWLRNRVNTTATLLVHIGYNSLAIILAYLGLGI